MDQRVKPLRRNYRCKFLLPGLNNGFLHMTPKAQAIKENFGPHHSFKTFLH
jgi:hypothetical protein